MFESKGRGPLVFIFIIFFIYPSFYWTQNYHWANSVGGKAMDLGIAITVDKSGNSYALGLFNDTVDFDTGPNVYDLVQTSTPYGDIYILKLDSLGKYIWAKRIGGSGSVNPQNITIDEQKNIYFSGQFYNTIDFDPGPANYSIAAMAADCFVVKLDSSGNFRWCKVIGGYGCGCMPNTIAYNNGKLIIGGYFLTSVSGYPVDFDPGPALDTLSSGNYIKAFMVKLDTAGNFIWRKALMKQPGLTAASGAINSIITSTAGNIYATGYFRNNTVNDPFDFDPGPGTYSLSGSTGGFYDSFTMKLDANGGFVWAKSFVGDGTYDGSPKSIALDENENVYTTGPFANTIDLDPTTSTLAVVSMGSWDVFITKLDVNGSLIWGKTFGGVGEDYAACIVSDNANNLCLSGYASSGCDLDPGSGTNTITCLGQDGYISSLDQNGDLLWFKSLNSLNANSFAAGRSLFIDKKNNFYLTGEYQNNIDLNPDLGNYNALSNNGSPDVFVLKLGTCNIPLDISPSSTICVNECTSLTASSAGSYTWAGGPYTSEYTVCPTSSTIYSVSGTISLGCIRSNSVMVTVYPCTTISENNLSYANILVYPNPVKDKLKIDVGSFSVSSIIITNILGHPVLELSHSIREIDISNFASGVYFLNLQVDGLKKTFKIIKE